jgi:aminopeptidase N
MAIPALDLFILIIITILDVIAIPDLGFAGMENWGLITVDSANALPEPVIADRAKMSTAMVMAHEVAHQVSKELILREILLKKVGES